MYTKEIQWDMQITMRHSLSNSMLCPSHSRYCTKYVPSVPSLEASNKTRRLRRLTQTNAD